MSEETLVGIDLGTTNSAIAVVASPDRVEVLPNAEGAKTTPSVVQIRPDGSTIVGELARRELVLEKERTALFFKRDMGTSSVYEYGGRCWTPTDLSVEVLKKLKADAENYLHRAVRKAVITVPAYFQDAARVATQNAGERAGLEVLQIINEPTAAALAYGFRHVQREETLLVYDLGGGTFDITLVHVGPDGIRVIGTDGNHHLGGKDWDDCLVQHLCEKFRGRHGADPLDDPSTYQELVLRAEEARKALSASLKASVSINFMGRMERIEVTRDELESLTRDLLGQTEILMGKVLEETGYSYSQIAGVLMAGGATRMPACRALVQRLSGKPPNTAVNPDECVAIGAAVQASVYAHPEASGGKLAWRGEIQDVMSHSMGMIAISADGRRYVNSILIPKNRTIPCRETRPFQARTRKKENNSIAVYVTQGESEDPADCSYVGKYTIRELPHEASGVAIVDIAYEYDRSGVVHVSATDRGQGNPMPIEKEVHLGDTSWVLRPPQEAAHGEHKTVYAAVDLSGSMAGKPLEDVQAAVQGFIENVDLAHTSIGLISFADSVVVDQQASQNAKSLLRAVSAWQIGPVGYGNSAHPFDEAYRASAQCERATLHYRARGRRLVLSETSRERCKSMQQGRHRGGRHRVR